GDRVELIEVAQWTVALLLEPASAAAQVGLLDERVLEQLLRGAGEDDFAHLKHVAAMGDRERHVHVLLDHEDGGALLVDGADDVEDLLTRRGARPMGGSSMQSSVGRVISARPMASIRCSPPDLVPAGRWRRSLSSGK